MAIDLTETQIEELILTHLNFKKRIFAWKVPKSGYFDTKRGIFRKQVSRFAINGNSDIAGFLPGKGLYIEVKTPKEYRYLFKHYEAIKGFTGECKKKNHLKEQIDFIERAQASGNAAFFADSVECVEAELGKLEGS